MEISSKSLGSQKMPYLLYLVEVVLAYNLSSSLYKFATFTLEFDTSTLSSAIDSLYILLSTILVSELTIRSMIRLPTAVKSTWRFTCKALMTQAVVILANVYIFGNWSSNPLIQSEVPIAALCMICVLIMFLPHVRRYYNPPNLEVPGSWDWFLYIIYKHKKEKKYRYEFGYDDPESRSAA